MARARLELVVDDTPEDTMAGTASLLSQLLDNTEFRIIEVSEATYVLGRNTFKEIAETLRKDSWFKRLSRSHFYIERRPVAFATAPRGCDHAYEYWIGDMSVNGTFLNGRIIGRNKSERLADRDTVSVLQRQGDPNRFNLEFVFRISCMPPLCDR